MSGVFKTVMKATKPEYDRFIRRAVIRDMGCSYLFRYYVGLDPDDTTMYKQYLEQYRLSIR